MELPMSDNPREVVQQLMFKENKSLLARKVMDVVSGFFVSNFIKNTCIVVIVSNTCTPFLCLVHV